MTARAHALSAVLLASTALGVARPAAQAPEPPAFVAASFKRNLAGSGESTLQVRPGGRLAITNETLRSLIRVAFQLQPEQLDGGPDWLATERWDVLATSDRAVREIEMFGMLRRLLVERLGLKMHEEQRDVPAFALVLANPDRGIGPAMKISTRHCDVPGSCPSSLSRGKADVMGRNVTSLLRYFSAMSGRSVVDKTGLTGAYDFTLTFRVEEQDASQPSIFTALEEQLGLKLVPERTTLTVSVIDAAERPAAD